MASMSPMDNVTHIVGVSGGKDSTALALLLAEREPRDYTYLITPTGNELPEMEAHWLRLETLLGKPLTRVTNGTLDSWIGEFDALPNHRQRWCTRLLKIEPTIAFVRAHMPAINYVGLRADEEERVGIYGEIPSRFPLREWGFGLPEVLAYLKERDIAIPARTDCYDCYGQRLVEWRNLLRKHPDLYAKAEAKEAATGRTFRSAKRDTWPAPLSELRAAFESGRKLRGEKDCDEDNGEGAACRVCKL